jgi:hypothetical protein
MPRVSLLPLSLLIASFARGALAAPFVPGNLLVTGFDASVSTSRSLREYTPAGVLIQTIAVPYPGTPSFTERPRGMTMTPGGQVALFNGTFNPYLSILDPPTGAWTHSTYPEWSTANVGGWGDVAAFDGTFFVPDAQTFGGGTAAGLIRFDPATSSAIRFATDYGYREVAASSDGLLYAMRAPGDSNIDVYDPSTLALVRNITLQRPGGVSIFSFALDAQGDIFTVTGNGGQVLRFASDGTLLQSSNVLIVGDTVANLLDIDISAWGTLLIGTGDGYLFFGDRALGAFTSFRALDNPAYVQIVTPEPRTGVLIALGLAGLVARGRARA